MATNVWHIKGLNQVLIDRAKASALTRQPKKVSYGIWLNEAIEEKLQREARK